MTRQEQDSGEVPAESDLLTLGEAARRLNVDAQRIHAWLGDGTLRHARRDPDGRLWFSPATLDRLALVVGGSTGKAIDDGRPKKHASPRPHPSSLPDED